MSIQKKTLLFFSIGILLIIFIWFIQQQFFGKAKEDSVASSHYQLYEAACTVNIPFEATTSQEYNAKWMYIVSQKLSLSPIPSNIAGGTDLSESIMAGELGFDEACPVVFNHAVLSDVYIQEAKEQFLEDNKGFESQSTFDEVSPQSCKISMILPYFREDHKEQLTLHLSQRLRSFKEILSLTPLNNASASITLSFSSSCDEVLSDYFMQRLFPADYYRLR